MKKDGLDGIGKIKIYKSTVYRVYAENFSIVKNRPNGNKKVEKNTAYFYRTVDGNDVCIDIDMNKVFKDRNDAINKCDKSIQKYAVTIKQALSGEIKDPREARRILIDISKATETFYYSSRDFEFAYEMPKKKLKQMITDRENKK